MWFTANAVAEVDKVSKTETFLNKLETLLLVLSYPSLEEDRVSSVLRVEKRVVAEHAHEEVDAVVALVEVRVVLRQGDGTAGASEMK